MAKNGAEIPTMDGKAALDAIAKADAIYVGVRLGLDEEVTYMKWRDKSEALRKRVRKMITDACKADKDATFKASLSDVGGEMIFILGDHRRAA